MHAVRHQRLYKAWHSSTRAAANLVPRPPSRGLREAACGARGGPRQIMPVEYHCSRTAFQPCGLALISLIGGANKHKGENSVPSQRHATASREASPPTIHFKHATFIQETNRGSVGKNTTTQEVFAKSRFQSLSFLSTNIPNIYKSRVSFSK